MLKNVQKTMSEIYILIDGALTICYVHVENHKGMLGSGRKLY